LRRAAQALSIGIKDFSFVKCGFPKFVDFLRHILHESKLALIHHKGMLLTECSR